MYGQLCGTLNTYLGPEQAVPGPQPLQIGSPPLEYLTWGVSFGPALAQSAGEAQEVAEGTLRASNANRGGSG